MPALIQPHARHLCAALTAIAVIATTLVVASEAPARAEVSGWHEPVPGFTSNTNWQSHSCDGSGGYVGSGLVHMGADIGGAAGSTVVSAIGPGTAVYLGGAGTQEEVLHVRHTTGDGTVFHAIYGHTNFDGKFGGGGSISVPVAAGERLGVLTAHSGDAHLHFAIWQSSSPRLNGWGRRSCGASEPPIDSSLNQSFRAPHTWLKNHPAEASGTESADASVVDNQGRVHSFVTDRTGRLWRLTKGTSGAWTWHDMGRQGSGFVGATPVAVLDGNGRILVFVAARGGLLWKLTRAPAGGPWAWAQMGEQRGFAGATPTATHDDQGRVHVFTVGTDGHLWKLTRATDGVWSWSDRGSPGDGLLGATPTALRDRTGRILVFVAAEGGQLWKLTRSPSGSGGWNWAGMGKWDQGFREAAPTAVSDADGRVHVFTVDAGGGLWRLTRNLDNAWSWHDMGARDGGFRHGDLSAVADADGRVLVFAPTQNGRIWKLTRPQGGSWGWADLGTAGSGFARGRVSSTFRPTNNTVDVFAVAAGGQLRRVTRWQGSWTWAGHGAQGGGFGGDPFGDVNTMSSPETGAVRVRGWIIDQDVPAGAVRVTVTVGGARTGAPLVTAGIGPASLTREDVGDAYPGTGVRHGFDATVRGVPNGIWDVYVYGDNIVPTLGATALIERGTVHVPFADVAADQLFYDEIMWAATEGVSTGYGDGTFRPAAAVSRMAMAAFMHRLAGEPAGSASCTQFTDV